MSERPILFFDSGIGGLTVLREARIFIPDRHFIYLADDAAFPYGAWEERDLKKHIIELFDTYLKQYDPALCVVACNTAST
ncbi:MAG: glutamate racemase, partial [Bartonella sp.]|nr:glutamate racemase [Bartonella sp.]